MRARSFGLLALLFHLACGGPAVPPPSPLGPSGTTMAVSSPPASPPPAPPPPPAASSADDVPASVLEDRARRAQPIAPPPSFTCRSTGPVELDLFKGRLAVNTTFDKVDPTRICRGSSECPRERPTCLLCPSGKMMVPYTPRDMNVAIAPPDRGVCVGTNNTETAFGQLLSGGELPNEAACIAKVLGKEALTTEPGACEWLSPWTQFLKQDQKLSDAFLRDHVRVKTWEVGPDGSNRMFVVHYAFTFDWVDVDMNDAFETRMSGSSTDRKPDEFITELRAQRLTGNNQPHAWYLKPIKRIVSRKEAEAKVRSCPKVSGSIGPGGVGLGEDGHPFARAVGVMDRGGHCPAATVDLTTGSVSCHEMLCAVF